MFDAMLNWNLLEGSHEFPGPEGGACLTEAAVVVAGFEYREVASVSDLPPCFSRPISSFALHLNDSLGFEARQKLKPFVVRLAGSADDARVERERVEYLIREIATRLLRPLLQAEGLHHLASFIPDSPSMPSLKDGLERIDLAFAGMICTDQSIPIVAWMCSNRVISLHSATRDYYDYNLVRSAQLCAEAVCSLRSSEDFAIELLDGMLNIGNKAEPVYPEVAGERLAKLFARPDQELLHCGT